LRNFYGVYIQVIGGTRLVEALGYKPEGRGFDSQLCHWPGILATEKTRITSASLAARDASTATFEQTARMQ